LTVIGTVLLVLVFNKSPAVAREPTVLPAHEHLSYAGGKLRCKLRPNRCS